LRIDGIVTSRPSSTPMTMAASMMRSGVMARNANSPMPPARRTRIRGRLARPNSAHTPGVP
jgi:hypothetical protein